MDSSDRKNGFIRAAECALLQSLAVKPGEKILLICDDSIPKISRAFVDAAKINGLSLTVREISRTGRNGLNPDAETCAMMADFPVLVCPTYFSLTHCPALRAAAQKGIRAATLPGIDDTLFLNGMSVDPAELERRASELMSRLKNRSTILVTSEGGTHIAFSVKKHKFIADCARIDKPGVIGNLPGGEIFIAPDENSANGTVSFDGSIGSFEWRSGDSPACIDVVAGNAQTFSGPRALKLHEILFEAGECAFQLGEFGIGINSELEFSGNLLGDEKLAGTVHLAFGNNRSFGGSCDAPVHIDGLVFRPDIIADGVPVMKGGVLCPLK